MAERMETWIREQGLKDITTDQNYQLNIEDAEYISHFDLVIFLDASVGSIDSVLLEGVKPDLKTDFSMHSASPSFIVGLCQNIFKKSPEAYQLHLKAYKFNFMKPITRKAKRNLDSGFAYLKEFIVSYHHSS